MVTKPSSLSRPTVSSSWRFHWDSLSTSAICMLPSTSAYFFPACHHICRLCSRDALDTAIDLLHQRLRIAIGEETDRTVVVNMILDTINYFDPIRTKTIQEFCFLWITDILNSRWTAEEQYQTAGRAVELAWKRIAPEIISIGFCDVKTDWAPPLLGFLQLNEEICSTETQQVSGVLALRILSACYEYGNVTPTMLQVLTPTLIPTHPLSSRKLALRIFHRFIPQWFSQMENVSNKDRAGLLQVVGDPFQSAPDPPLQYEEPVCTRKYEPMKAAVVLIEFASSALWRDHLDRSNFISCEARRTLSTKWYSRRPENGQHSFARPQRSS